MSFQDDLTLNSKKSEFDDSDFDLESLLADDDDDAFLKKALTSSPTKKSGFNTVAKPSVEKADHGYKASEGATTGTEDAAGVNFLSKKSPEHFDVGEKSIESQGSNLKFDGGTAKAKHSSVKSNDSLFSEETKYLNDLKVNELSFATSPQNITDDSLLKAKISDGDDFLKKLGFDEPVHSSPKKSTGFFLDDFLKLPSEFSEKKVPDAKSEDKKVKESEEDVLGSYVPTVSKKRESIPNETLQSHRAGLLKQVSFKDVSEESPKKASLESKALPPKEEDKSNSDSKSRVLPKTKRSERMGSKDGDTDWLSFFKDSPKGPPKPPKMHAEEKELPQNVTRLTSRRRSSGAEWLGLGESRSEIKSAPAKGRGKLEDDWLQSGENSAVDKIPSLMKPPKKTIPEMDNGLLGSGPEKHIKGNIVPKTVEKKEESVGRRGLKDSIDRIVLQKDFTREQQSEFTVGGNNQVLPPASIPPNIETVSTASVSQNLSSVHSDAYHSLQAKLTECLLEKDQLSKLPEKLKLTHEEEIKTIKALHKNQLTAAEESFKMKETSLRAELGAKIETLEEKLKWMESEKKQLEMDVKVKLNELEDEHRKEVQRLKALHSQSIQHMKQDHEDALMRLKRLKEQEIEALLSTQSHSRSLQHLTDQLEARASELASLQAKVEQRSELNMMDKQALLESKGKELKALQSRLQRQLEDSDEERSRLQQLVLRLESRLQKYTMEGEEDRYEVQRLKSKLVIQQKHLEEEYKFHQQQIEKEKEKLQLSQSSLLQEQRTVLLQLAQERQLLTQEKAELAATEKRRREEEAKWNVKKIREESALEAQKRSLQQEESKLYFEKEQVKQTSQQLEREQLSLQRETQQLREERERGSELQSVLKRKTQEVEQLMRRMSEVKEQCRLEQEAALRIKAEHQSRSQHYAQQMQMLMEKERKILEEREKLAEEKVEFESKKNVLLCSRCKVSSELPMGDYGPIHCTTAPPVVPASLAPMPFINGISSSGQVLGRDPSLVVWYVAAQRDREFLQDELTFLQSLKDSSKRNK